DREVVGVSVTQLGGSDAARDEWTRGVRGMLARIPRQEVRIPGDGGVVLGVLARVHQSAPQWQLAANLQPEPYWLKTVRTRASRYTVIAGADDRGVLYGTFALLRKIALKEPIDNLDEKQMPYAPVRWVNHWDNLDGTIERGYGGRSIFWDNLHARADLSRVND